MAEKDSEVRLLGVNPVLKAVKQDGYALQRASEELKKDPALS